MRESARYNFKVCPAKIEGLAAPIIFEDFLEHLTFYCDLFHKEANPVVVSLSNHGRVSATNTLSVQPLRQAQGKPMVLYCRR